MLQTSSKLTKKCQSYSNSLNIQKSASSGALKIICLKDFYNVKLLVKNIKMISLHQKYFKNETKPIYSCRY